jgi:hypothetical protein
VDGYYLTLKNDTVGCKIEPRELGVFDKVTIIDAAEKYITYKSKDPNGAIFRSLYRWLIPLLDPDERKIIMTIK